MSVINKMLQELEQRKSGGAAKGGLPKEVRPSLPPHRDGKWGKAGAALLILAGLGLAAWYGAAWLGGGVSSAVKPGPAIAPQAALEPVPVPRFEAALPEPQAARPVEAAPAPAPKKERAAKVPPAGEGAKAEEPGRRRAKAAKAAVADAGNAPLKTTSPRQEAEYRYQKALALLQEGRVAEAQEHLEGALAADPGHGASRQLLAGVLIEGKKGREAEEVLKKGLEMSPEQSSLATLLARLQMERGETRGAIATLRRSLPHAADNASYQALLAALLQRTGRHGEAVEHYLAALRQSPSSGPWLIGLGISLQAENRLDDARSAFTRAKQSGVLSADLEAFADQRLKQLRPTAEN